MTINKHDLKICPMLRIIVMKESTIITSLYDIGNTKFITDMLKNSHHWLNLTFPLVIWTDDLCYAQLSELFGNKKNIKIYKKNLNEFIPYQYIELISRLYHSYDVTNRNNMKDTILYHLLSYSRPYMWSETVHDNPFKTQTFICADYSIFNCGEKLLTMEQWDIQDKIKLMLINPYLPKSPPPHIYFHLIHHNVATGLLTGSGENIMHFVQLFTQELHQMLADQWLQLDQAIIICILHKSPQLCDYFYGDYCSLITNYDKIRNTTNIHRIVRKYLDNQMYREAQKVIDSIDYYFSDDTLTLFVEMSILTNYYTLDCHLDVKVKQLIDDPKYHELLSHILKENENNLKFYK
jgi:hypothetical protein